MSAATTNQEGRRFAVPLDNLLDFLSDAGLAVQSVARTVAPTQDVGAPMSGRCQGPTWVGNGRPDPRANVRFLAASQGPVGAVTTNIAQPGLSQGRVAALGAGWTLRGIREYPSLVKPIRIVGEVEGLLSIVAAAVARLVAEAGEDVPGT